MGSENESCITIQKITNEKDHASLEKKINSITKSLSKPNFNKILKNLIKTNANNTKTICNYIIAKQTELNIKDSTKEGKIKNKVEYSFPISNYFSMLYQ